LVGVATREYMVLRVLACIIISFFVEPGHRPDKDL
jgi:hypothetical protein